MLLQNKIRRHFESWDTMAQVNTGEKLYFNSSIIININNNIIECKDKIKVYYTNTPLKKIEKAS